MGVRGGLLLKTKKDDVEDMKGLSWRSLKSSAPLCEPQPLWAAAKHDIALARLGASYNASKSEPGSQSLVLLAYKHGWFTLHMMLYWEYN